MPQPGDILSERYRLLDRLGSGGMGEVYRADDLLLRRPVAVKLLPLAMAGDPAVVARFEREARAAAALHHPNIVTLFDQGIDGTPFLVMELVDGGSVADLLRHDSTLPIGRAVEIAVEVLDALEHAHDRGVVHCDVKAENVLLSADGQAKLADFGIARVATEATLTVTGQVHGSAHYLAPERMTGESASPASDLYSIGVLLYRMLTGRFPFSGDHPAAIAAQHERHPPRPPSETRPDVPAWLDAVVLRALAKRPADRFPSAGAMRAALAGAAIVSTDEPTRQVAATASPEPPTRVITPAARPPTAPTRSVPATSERHTRAWIAGGLAAIAALILLVAALSGGEGEPSSSSDGSVAAGPTATFAPVPTQSGAAPPDVEPTEPAEQAAPPPTATTQPAAEATAPAPEQPAGSPQAHLDALRSLVASADDERWKPNTRHDLVRRIDDIERRLTSDKPKDVEDKIDDLREKVSDLANDGELDAAMADRILNEIDALEESV